MDQKVDQLGGRDGKMGTNWNIAVIGQMGINLQLLDVTYPCSEGWEGPELASSAHYAR